LRRTPARRSSDRFDRFAARKISTFCESQASLSRRCRVCDRSGGRREQLILKDSRISIVGHPNPSSRPRRSVSLPAAQRFGLSSTKDSHFVAVEGRAGRRAFLWFHVKTFSAPVIAICRIFSCCKRGSRSPPSRA
jgi:hypothetical protein